MTTYRRIHTAYTRGYMSRKDKRTAGEKFHDGDRTPYNGKYGKGFTVETPAYNTTQYHFITYFIQMEV